MQGTRLVKDINSWKPISRRPIGRQKTRWVKKKKKKYKEDESTKLEDSCPG
jgi:hypothetical protein